MTPTFNCPFCAHDNPRGARFCNECGSPLHLAPCAHCDAVNDVELSACYSCGAPLPRVADTAIDERLAAIGVADDEPSHSILSDIDVDALDAEPRRDTRRGVVPMALAALTLLVASGALVGYVAWRQGVLPGVFASVAPPSSSAPARESVAAVREEAARDLRPPEDARARTPAPVDAPAPAAATDPSIAAPTEDPAATDAAKAASSSATPETVKPAPAVAAPPSPPRRAPAAKAEPAVDKDAAATQSLIRREIGGFGPPKPLPPRAPPDSH